MATTLLTGKSATFTYGTTQGEAQITTFATDATATSETVETLAGSAPLSSKKEYTATVTFLFDGNLVGGGFYKACEASYTAASSGVVSFTIGAFTEAGTGTVTGLSKESPADGAVTAVATILCTGMTPTYPVA